MCDPTGGWLIGLGVAQAALGVVGSVASYQQANEQAAYQNAVAQQNYQFQQMQASAARGFEQMRYNQQEALMQTTRFFADQAYADDIAQLNLRLLQEQEAAAQQKQQAGKQTMQAKGEALATGRSNATIDSLIADYYRQQAQFDFATERNLAFTTAQVQEAKRGSAATRGSRIASQQPYIRQPILDPLEPIPQPSPSAAPYIISGLGSVVGAASSTVGGIYKVKTGGLTGTNSFKQALSMPKLVG